MDSKALEIDRTWTLFLDRDGTLNTRLVGEYVRDWNEFEFIEGTLEAMKILAEKFGTIIIVTNQQGIGKGLMTVSDLNAVHDQMTNEVVAAGGRIDWIYFAPELRESSPFHRKPLPAMGHLAQADFPAIDFKKSVMVGDMPSDIEFGQSLEMMTVQVGCEFDGAPKADYQVDTLLSFAEKLV